MIRQDLLGHPKVAALAEGLGRSSDYLADNPGVAECAAIGLLLRMWNYCGKYYPTGDITTLSPRRLATAVGWPQDSGSGRAILDLVSACGFVDIERSKSPPYDLDGVYLHEWSTHAPDWVHAKLIRAHMLFHDNALPKIKSISGPDMKRHREWYDEAKAIARGTSSANGRAASSATRSGTIAQQQQEKTKGESKNTASVKDRTRTPRSPFLPTLGVETSDDRKRGGGGSAAAAAETAADVFATPPRPERVEKARQIATLAYDSTGVPFEGCSRMNVQWWAVRVLVIAGVDRATAIELARDDRATYDRL